MAGANGKFDVCIQNPPYDKNLHLKFLEKVIQISDEVVSIQPSDYFTNMNVANKMSKEIARHIESLEVIPVEEANKIFNIYNSCNLGIGVFSNKILDTYKPDNGEFAEIVEKIRKEKSIRSSINYHRKRMDVHHNFKIPVQGCYGYAKGWHYTLDGLFRGDCNAQMGFDTEEEMNNFIKSVKTTWPYKLMYIIDDKAAVPAHLPFMKDYTKEWTDERFYKYFNITPKQRKDIEQFIKDNE